MDSKWRHCVISVGIATRSPIPQFSRGVRSSVYTDASSDGRHCCASTRFIPLDGLHSDMSLEETVDYLAEELDLERSEHVREVGQSVAELRD